MEVMGLHFSSHILFPVFFFAQLHIGCLDAMVKRGIYTEKCGTVWMDWASVWKDDSEAKDGLILEWALFISPALGRCSPRAVAKGKWGKRIWKLSTKPLLLLKTLECFSERPVMVVMWRAQELLFVEAQMRNCLWWMFLTWVSVEAFLCLVFLSVGQTYFLCVICQS